VKNPGKTVFCATLALCAACASAQDMPRDDFKAFIRNLKQFDPQWAGPSKKACDRIREFLKKENVTLDQKCQLLAEMYPYARRVGDAEADAIWTQITALPDCPAKKAAMVRAIGLMPLETAERTARANAGIFQSKIAMCASLATAAVKAGNLDAAVRLTKELSAEKVADPEKNDPRKTSIKIVLRALASADFEAAKALCASVGDIFGADAPYTFLPVFMEAARRLRDREAFDAELAKARRLAEPNGRFEVLLAAARCLRAGHAYAAADALLDELEKEADTDAKKLNILQMKVPWLPRYFEYGLPTRDIYRKWKAAVLPLIALQEKLNTRKPGFLASAAQYSGYAADAFTFGDYAFADELLRKYFTVHPDAFNDVQLELALYRNNRVLASGQIAKALAATNVTPADTDYYKALQYFDKGGKIAGFDRAVFGDRKFTPEERLTVLRRTSHKFFRAYRYDIARMIESEIQTNMFIPFVRPSHVVRFDRKAPQSADSWAKSSYYNDWDKMFTSFEVSGKAIDRDQKVDMSRHLKGCDAPKTDPAYRTGLQVLCDVSGVHFYGRFADPQPQDFVLKKRDGGEAEFTLRPGRDADFHYTGFLKDLPDVNDPYEVEWALPSKKYRMGCDYIRKDAAPTPDGLAVHVLIPWRMVYANLPINGKTWGFGFGRHGTDVQGKRFSYTICGARVQELERSLELRFELTASDLRDLKRSICLVACNTYDALRNDKNEFIFLWSDPTIGDRDFFAKEVQPLITDLDSAGKKVREGLSEKDVDLYFEKYVPQWLEVNFIIQDLRTKYLRHAVKTQFE